MNVLEKVIAKAARDKSPVTRYVKGLMPNPAIALRNSPGDRIFDKVTLSQFK